MGEAKRKAELLERVNGELREGGTRPVIVNLNVTGAVAMCGAMQCGRPRWPQEYVGLGCMVCLDCLNQGGF